MNVKLWTIGLLMIVCCLWPATPTLGQDKDAVNTKLNEQRKLLAGVKPGMSSDEVLKVLGKPDEVRLLPDSPFGSLDGTRYLGSGLGYERQRWAYGILGKGMFASVGYVSLDGNGKVMTAIPTDMFLTSMGPAPGMVLAKSESVVESPLKLSCHVGPVQVVPAAGDTAAMLKTRVTLKNNGFLGFELKDDAASSMRRFLKIEVYDAKGTMLFREDQMRYHSPFSFDPSTWPVFSIPAGKEIAQDLSFSPAHGFGPLPPGKYAVRIYFPFEKDKNYPSNLVVFEVK